MTWRYPNTRPFLPSRARVTREDSSRKQDKTRSGLREVGDYPGFPGLSEPRGVFHLRCCPVAAVLHGGSGRLYRGCSQDTLPEPGTTLVHLPATYHPGTPPPPCTTTVTGSVLHTVTGSSNRARFDPEVNRARFDPESNRARSRTRVSFLL